MIQTAVPETVTFPYYADSTANEKDISVDIFPVVGEETAETFTPDTVLFCGIGNEGKVPVIGAQRLGRAGVENLVLVSALPYWEARPDDTGLTNLGIQALQAVSQHVREKYGATELHAGAESQAGPALMETAKEDPLAFEGRLAFLRVLGLNHMSTKRFLARLGQTGLQWDQLRDPAITDRVGTHAVHRLLQDERRGGGQLQFALDFAGAATICELAAQGRDVAVIAADNDKIFPPEEQSATLRALDSATKVDVHIIHGTHTSPASKAGVHQVAQMVRWCRTKMWDDAPAGTGRKSVLHSLLKNAKFAE